MTADDRTIYERIADASKDIAATDFKKDGTVKVGGRDSYNFIPIGQILNAVRTVHAKHGIIVVFGRPEYDVANAEKRYTYTKKSSFDGKESQWFAANGHIDVTIYGRNGDYIEVSVPCEAQDNSDKLTNKLVTNAERCLYRTLYAIDEGDATDPEAFNEPVSEPVSDGFFGTPVRGKKAKSTAEKAMGRDADFIDGDAIMQAQRNAEASVDLKHARVTLAKVMNESPGMLDRYIQIAKSDKLNDWPEEVIRKAYVDVMQAEEGDQ